MGYDEVFHFPKYDRPVKDGVPHDPPKLRIVDRICGDWGRSIRQGNYPCFDRTLHHRPHLLRVEEGGVATNQKPPACRGSWYELH